MIMKTLLTFLLLVNTHLVVAQEGVPFNQQIWCFDQKAVIETLPKDFKETPIFLGQATDIQYVLYTNEKTGGWTMIGFKDGLGCIVAAGKKHTHIVGPRI